MASANIVAAHSADLTKVRTAPNDNLSSARQIMQVGPVMVYSLPGHSALRGAKGRAPHPAPLRAEYTITGPAYFVLPGLIILLSRLANSAKGNLNRLGKHSEGTGQAPC